MKNIKKVLCLVLTLMMVCSITCATAFASDDDDNSMPEGLVRTTIEVTLAPDDDGGIMPLIWGQTNPLVGNTTSKTSEFTVPERYFAFECTATSWPSGGTADGNCCIDFYRHGETNDCLIIPIDGEMYKADWIDLHGSNTVCYFKLQNSSSDFISVLITYYSWA